MEMNKLFGKGLYKSGLFCQEFFTFGSFKLLQFIHHSGVNINTKLALSVIIHLQQTHRLFAFRFLQQGALEFQSQSFGRRSTAASFLKSSEFQSGDTSKFYVGG